MPIMPRANMKAALYYRISNKYTKIIENLAQNIDILDPEEDPETYYELLDEYRENEIIVVVFASMAVEAFIYDYALSRLSEGTFNKRLKSLSLYDKWREIPKLVTGQEIKQDSQAMQHLDALIKVRNSLVHSKSFPKSSLFDEEIAKQVHDLNRKVSLASVYALDTIEMLMTELDEIDHEKPSKYIFI